MRLVLIALLAVGLTGPARAQSTYDTYTGWAVDATPVLPAAEAHPSLYFGADDLDALRARWTDPAYADITARIRSDIASFKSRSASSTNANDRPRMAKVLAFAWLMDGDLIARVKAYEALTLAYQNVTRAATSAAFGGSTDEIYRATWLQNYCEAYDWMHDVIEPADRETIRAALAQETALLADNMVSGVRYAPRPHNHRSKPAYAVGTAALTLSSDPRAGAWLALALEQQNTTTRYQFSADGVYREGSHYWVYTLVNAIPFMWHYRNVSGVDLFPAYQPTFEWAVQTRTGRGWMPALEDGFPKPAMTHMVAAAYASSPTLLHPTAPLGQILQWNWETTDFFTNDYTGATTDTVWELDEFITEDRSIPATPPGVAPTQRLASGQIAFRSDWNAGSAETRTLLFHGVASADNHDHPDLMSYMFDAENTPLAVDAGYGPDGFSDDRRAWYTSAQAHNVVTVNGFAARDLSLQQNQGPEQTAFVDGPAFAAAEMRAPNNGVMGGATTTRGVAMLDSKYFVVYDHVEALQSASIQVHLHGRGEPARTDNRVTWTAPNDAIGDGGRMHAAFFSDGPLAYDTGAGWTSFYFNREEDQTDLAARRTAAAATFLHTIEATPASGSASATVDHTNGALVSAEIATETGAWHLATQRDRALRTADRLSTDATFAAVGRQGGTASRWGLVRGTTLAYDGTALIESTAPITVSADLRDARTHTLVVELVGVTTLAPTLTVQLLPASSAPTAVTLDGASVSFEALGTGRVRFTIGTGGTILITTDASVATETGASLVPLQIRATPNPSAGPIEIALDVPAATEARIAVYDVLGRRVRTLLSGPAAPGRLAVSWDGLTDDGTRAAPGVYTVVADAAGARVSTRITRLR